MTQFSKPAIFITEAGNDAVRPAAANPEIRLEQPPYRMDFGWCSELTWELRVTGTYGSPSAWSLGVKFQYRQDHTSGYQYTAPTWSDLDDYTISSDVVGGKGWYSGTFTPPTNGDFGIVADNTSTLPLMVKRTLKNFPIGVRVVLDPKFTGGTNPGLKLSLVCYPKG